MAAPIKGGDSEDFRLSGEEPQNTLSMEAGAAAIGAAGTESATASIGGRVSAITGTEIRQVDDAATFRVAIAAAKKEMERDWADQEHANAFRAVDVYDDYTGLKLFLYADNKGGFAIKDGDEIVSVFCHKSAGKLRPLMERAIEEGGRRLDCFEKTPFPLPTIYASYGFEPIAKVQFDPSQTPEGWDTRIEADVIFMVYNHSSAESLPQDPVQRRVAAKDRVTEQIRALPQYLEYGEAALQAKGASGRSATE